MKFHPTKKKKKSVNVFYVCVKTIYFLILLIDIVNVYLPCLSFWFYDVIFYSVTSLYYFLLVL